MKTLLTAIAILAVTLSAMLIIEHGVEKQEKVECQKWQRQAKEIKMGWYAMSWQINQCSRYNIPLQ